MNLNLKKDENFDEPLWFCRGIGKDDED